MTKWLNGKELADFIKERQARQVRGLRQAHGVAPRLAIVQCKDDPVINTYVRLKKKYGADIGIEVDAYMVEQAKAAELIKRLNDDETVHGIIVQLPLAEPAQTDEIVNLVAPEKDVDALGDPETPWPGATHASAMQEKTEHRTEVYKQYAEGEAEDLTQQSAASDGRVSGSARKQAVTMRGSRFDPATPMAILWLLAGYNIDLKDKQVLLIGQGKLVGAPLARILRNSGVAIDIADRETTNLAEKTLEADVIITATGSPAILYPDMIKQNAVVVDAGVAGEEGKTVGDVAPEVYERTDLTITPAKGGVGPLTVCALFDNVIRAARQDISV